MTVLTLLALWSLLYKTKRISKCKSRHGKPMFSSMWELKGTESVVPQLKIASRSWCANQHGSHLRVSRNSHSSLRYSCRGICHFLHRRSKHLEFSLHLEKASTWSYIEIVSVGHISERKLATKPAGVDGLYAHCSDHASSGRNTSFGNN